MSELHHHGGPCDLCDAQEKRLAELEAEVARLQANGVTHYHYHYQQPQQQLYQYPAYPQIWWCGKDSAS